MILMFQSLIFLLMTAVAMRCMPWERQEKKNTSMQNILYRCPHSSFFYLIREAIGTAATPGLLCQPRVIAKLIVEKQMERRLTGETEVLGENLPQRHFCPSQNPT
jgi:hypothetical protein